MKSTEYAHTSIIGHIHSQTIFAAYVVFLPIVEHAFHWSISIITNHLPLGFWSTRFLYHYRPDPSLCFCPLLLVPYRIVLFLYMYNYIVYLYIHIYIYRSNFEFFTCQFSSMNMFCHVYIYMHINTNLSCVRSPLNICICWYLHKLGSSALQLEGGSTQTAEKRQEADFQDCWVVGKNGDDMFLKEPYPGAKLTWLWKTHCFPFGLLFFW